MCQVSTNVDGACVFVAPSNQDLERPAWPATTAKKACLVKLQIIALRRYIGFGMQHTVCYKDIYWLTRCTLHLWALQAWRFWNNMNGKPKTDAAETGGVKSIGLGPLGSA